jgi:hypothetical protein
MLKYLRNSDAAVRTFKKVEGKKMIPPPAFVSGMREDVRAIGADVEVLCMAADSGELAEFELIKEGRPIVHGQRYVYSHYAPYDDENPLSSVKQYDVEVKILALGSMKTHEEVRGVVAKWIEKSDLPLRK